MNTGVKLVRNSIKQKKVKNVNVEYAKLGMLNIMFICKIQSLLSLGVPKEKSFDVVKGGKIKAFRKSWDSTTREREIDVK